MHHLYANTFNEMSLPQNESLLCLKTLELKCMVLSNFNSFSFMLPGRKSYMHVKSNVCTTIFPAEIVYTSMRVTYNCLLECTYQRIFICWRVVLGPNYMCLFWTLFVKLALLLDLSSQILGKNLAHFNNAIALWI